MNGDREMAYSLYLAGFDVKDVHMTDLMSGRENLEDVNMIGILRWLLQLRRTRFSQGLGFRLPLE